MEQYLIPKELDFENLRFALDNYTPTFLYIRDCGGFREDGKYSCQGLTKVSEELEDKILDFKKDNSGLHMLVDSEEVFQLLPEDKIMKFFVQHDRIKLKFKKRSTFIIASFEHLMEIDFKEKINLSAYSKSEESGTTYDFINNPN
mgnify:CR=1 FL=1